MALDDTLLAGKLAREYDTEVKKLLDNSPTVLILGVTGAGKSSIINGVFGEVVAPVSEGNPCTQEFDYYPSKIGRTVHLYDSKGLENLDDTYVTNLKRFLQQRHGGTANGVHCVWYVVSAPTARWSDGDTRIVKEILAEIPTIIVLNKCDIATRSQKDAVITKIQECRIQTVKGIVEVAASPIKFDPRCDLHGEDDLSVSKVKQTWKCNECGRGGHLDLSPKGLDDLVFHTMKQMPELAKMSFLASQQARLESKKFAGYTVVAAASIAAYLVGWSPIPFSDAPILVGIQGTMAVSLSTIFGVFGSAIIPVISGQLAACAVGLGLASVLKLIPVVGTLAGMVIDSTLALILTAAVGLIYVALFSYVYKRVGNATAEKRTDLLVQLIASLDLKNIFLKVRVLFKGKLPTSKEELEKMLPVLGAQVEAIVEQEIANNKTINSIN